MNCCSLFLGLQKFTSLAVHWTGHEHRSPCSTSGQSAAVTFKCFKASLWAGFYQLQSHHKWRTVEKIPTSSSPAVNICLHQTFALTQKYQVLGCSCGISLSSPDVPARGRFLSISSSFPPRLGSRTASHLSQQKGGNKEDLSWAVWNSLHIQNSNITSSIY